MNVVLCSKLIRTEMYYQIPYALNSLNLALDGMMDTAPYSAPNKMPDNNESAIYLTFFAFFYYLKITSHCDTVFTLTPPTCLMLMPRFLNSSTTSGVCLRCSVTWPRVKLELSPQVYTSWRSPGVYTVTINHRSG